MLNLLIKTGRGGFRVKIKKYYYLLGRVGKAFRINQVIVSVNCSQTLVTCIKSSLIRNPGSRQRGTTIGSCVCEYRDHGSATCQLQIRAGCWYCTPTHPHHVTDYSLRESGADTSECGKDGIQTSLNVIMKIKA